MFHADQITEPPDSLRAAPEVSELPVAFKRGRVPVNVIVNMSLVRVCRYDKSVITLGKSHGKFISDFVGFLRRDFTRFEGLADLISDYIAFLNTACNELVLSL